MSVKLKNAKVDVKNRPSLADEISSSNLVSPGQRGKKRKLNEKGLQEETYIDSKLTQKIIKVAKEQLNETEVSGQAPRRKPQLPAADAGRRVSDSEDDDDEDSGSDVDEGEDLQEQATGEDGAELAQQLYSEEGGPLGRLNPEQLRSLIDEKRTELDTELGSDVGSRASVCSELPDAVRQHFVACRSVLQQYRSGKLPKPVKQLPHFGQWQELVELLEPNNWTAAAMCAVTKYFAAKGKAPALQFYQFYLLPRCRDDIAEYRRLNFHLYAALKKAMFRQREFCCGLLLPWARDGVSLPEATILGGLLRRVSIPVKYAAPALHMLLQLPYSGGRAILVRTMLEKKYNLPDMVVGQAVRHFLEMRTDYEGRVTEDGRLPVLWHQSLLALVQRYGAYLGHEERLDLLRLCRQHQHPDITPLVRQALGSAQQAEHMQTG